jgi:release factor glutamine methyltransferase
MKMFSLNDENISLMRAYKAAADFLKKSGVDDPETDAMLLLEKASGYTRNEYFMRRDEKLPDTCKEIFCGMISKRAERIPLQHITGEAYFYGRRFLVNENVLIPRMDTEVLVEEALKEIRPGMDVLDMCTGSGCIAVTVAKESGADVTAADISVKALETAKENARLNNADCVFKESDMFESIEGCFDVIISNPPYIKRGDIAVLQEEVRSHDPLTALDGGDDGLDFYRTIATEGAKHLKSGGRLFLEIGAEQADDVVQILNAADLSDIRVKNDLNGLPRVVRAVYVK